MKPKFISRIIQFIKDWHFVNINDKDVAHIFQGIGMRNLSIKYALKRHKFNSNDGLTGCRRHYVLRLNSRAYLVCNRNEVIAMKKKGLLNKNLNIDKILNNAYYVTA